MKITISLPDSQYEALEISAKLQNIKSVEDLVSKNLHLLSIVDVSKPYIILDSGHIATIRDALDGKPVKTADQVVTIVKNCLRLSVDGIAVQLAIEDAEALKAQWPTTGIEEFAKYIQDSTSEAFCTYLHGSTRGLIGGGWA